MVPEVFNELSSSFFLSGLSVGSPVLALKFFSLTVEEPCSRTFSVFFNPSFSFSVPPAWVCKCCTQHAPSSHRMYKASGVSCSSSSLARLSSRTAWIWASAISNSSAAEDECACPFVLLLCRSVRRLQTCQQEWCLSVSTSSHFAPMHMMMHPEKTVQTLWHVQFQCIQ